MVVQSAKAAKAAGAASTAEIRDFTSVDQLPRQDPHSTVDVAVSHSTLNYKDGLIVLGKPGVVKEFPIVPGIDFAGTVRSSRAEGLREGDAVVLTGNKSGQYFDGGYSQRVACQAEWLVPVPAPFSAADAMTIGTAGVTAMMCIQHLEGAGELRPAHGPVLVTGAAGGLGQIAISILAKRGYEVIASSGRADEQRAALTALGATEVIGRLEAQEKPLGPQRWAGVVDSVGGTTLAAAAAQTMYRGAIASAGVAGGGGFESSVYPFILRGVRLLGVDSTMPWNLDGYPDEPERWRAWRKERLGLWEDLADSITPHALAAVSSGSIGLPQVPEYAQRILDGKVAGRLVIEIEPEE